ncbi:hypothetical protein K9857_21750 [Pseudomonas sp. REP124]|uniref:hypothetical protein n=1 Tax=Pseudomonas sp. REP124 TaxID=2875731 RepID=UPI001CC965AD|nr:hypothetical protein [Pseudomonas sp. REP124]MBZ9784165.1 hypothetical protein [Pseudomonas sp. REP124]
MATHAAVRNASRRRQQMHNPLRKMWCEFTSQKAHSNWATDRRTVTPRKDPIQKLSDKAGILYWKLQQLLEKDDDDQETERQGNKWIGHPPAPLPMICHVQYHSGQ